MYFWVPSLSRTLWYKKINVLTICYIFPNSTIIILVSKVEHFVNIFITNLQWHERVIQNWKLIVPATTQNFTKKIFFFCINVNKNAKEKLSLGFWVSKIETDTAGARFPNSWCNQPPPPITISVNWMHLLFFLPTDFVNSSKFDLD